MQGSAPAFRFQVRQDPARQFDRVRAVRGSSSGRRIIGCPVLARPSVRVVRAFRAVRPSRAIRPIRTRFPGDVPGNLHEPLQHLTGLLTLERAHGAVHGGREPVPCRSFDTRPAAQLPADGPENTHRRPVPVHFAGLEQPVQQVRCAEKMPRRHDQHTPLEAGFAGTYEVLKPSQDAGIAHSGQRFQGGLDDRGVLLMLEQGFQRGFRAPVSDSIQGEHGASSDARAIVVQQGHQDVEAERRRHRAQGFHGLLGDVRRRVAHALEQRIHGLRRTDPAQGLYGLPSHVAVAVLQQRDQFVHGQVTARFTQFTGSPGPDRGVARFSHAHEVPQGRDGVPLAHTVDHVTGRYLRIGGHAGQQAHVGDAQRPVGKEEVLQSRKGVAEEGDGGNGGAQIGGNAAQYGAAGRAPSRYRGVATQKRGAVDRRGRLDDEIEPGGTPTRAHAAPPDLHQRHHDPVVFKSHESPSQRKHGQSRGGKRHDRLVPVLVCQVAPEGVHDDRGDGLYGRVDRDLGVGDLQRP